MSETLRKSVSDVAQAIDDLNRAFDQRTEVLRAAGDEVALRQWMTACIAMRDSGRLYLNWAGHYARTTEGATPTETDEDALLDEGSI